MRSQLHADKAALENQTKLRLLSIRERELNLYIQNCRTVGTVSAVLSGLTFSALVCGCRFEIFPCIMRRHPAYLFAVCSFSHSLLLRAHFCLLSRWCLIICNKEPSTHYYTKWAARTVEFRTPISPRQRGGSVSHKLSLFQIYSKLNYFQAASPVSQVRRPR